MSTYTHHVSGFFAQKDEAVKAHDVLLSRGIPAKQLALYADEQQDLKPEARPERRDSIKDMLVVGAIGTAVGAAVGTLGEIALVAASVTLFMAGSLIAPLAMLGWGAGLSTVIGAVAGSVRLQKQGGKLSDLVTDALRSGQVVLIVHTHSEQQTQIAVNVMQKAVGFVQEEDPS
jgi:hypothetical protein